MPQTDSRFKACDWNSVCSFELQLFLPSSTLSRIMPPCVCIFYYYITQQKRVFFPHEGMEPPGKQ